MSDTSVARTILAQLGGGRFVAMTGASSFASSSDTLSFRLPARFAKNGIRGVRIVLNASDTYTVSFLAMPTKANGYTVPTVAEYADIYADQLRDVFTHTTGLETSLGTMGQIRRAS